jgi:hypothetical protein
MKKVNLVKRILNTTPEQAIKIAKNFKEYDISTIAGIIKFDEIVKTLASNFHESWRRDFMKENGNVPRIKPAHDGTDNKIDINVPFENLTPYWQKDNLDAAKFVIKMTFICPNMTLNKIGELIHIYWKIRNPWAKGTDQYTRFNLLPNHEKSKDIEQYMLLDILLSNILDDYEKSQEFANYFYDVSDECEAAQAGICSGKCYQCKKYSNFKPIND